MISIRSPNQLRVFSPTASVATLENHNRESESIGERDVTYILFRVRATAGVPGRFLMPNVQDRRPTVRKPGCAFMVPRHLKLSRSRLPTRRESSSADLSSLEEVNRI